MQILRPNSLAIDVKPKLLNGKLAFPVPSFRPLVIHAPLRFVTPRLPAELSAPVPLGFHARNGGRAPHLGPGGTAC